MQEQLLLTTGSGATFSFACTSWPPVSELHAPSHVQYIEDLGCVDRKKESERGERKRATQRERERQRERDREKRERQGERKINIQGGCCKFRWVL